MEDLEFAWLIKVTLIRQISINEILPEEGVAHKLDKSMNRFMFDLIFFEKCDNLIDQR